MTDHEKRAIATALLLLFDGRRPLDIVDALTEALGHNNRSDQIAWLFFRRMGLSCPAVIGPFEVIDHIRELANSDAPDEYTLACTYEKLAERTAEHDWTDTNDMFSNELEQLLDELINEGLVKHTPLANPPE